MSQDKTTVCPTCNGRKGWPEPGGDVTCKRCGGEGVIEQPTAQPVVLPAEDVRALALALAPIFRAVGLAVVPREPTEEMMAAVECAGERRDWISGRAWRAGWVAMVEAARGAK